MIKKSGSGCMELSVLERVFKKKKHNLCHNFEFL